MRGKESEQDNDPGVEVGTIGRVKYPLNGFGRGRLTAPDSTLCSSIHQLRSIQKEFTNS